MPKLTVGILSGIGAGVLWGLVFLVPQVLSGFSPVEIAFGRFFFFGLVSVFSLRAVAQLFQRLTWRDRLRVVLLSASGYWFYTLLLFWSIAQSGGVVTTLMIGLLPVLIPLASKKTWRLRKEFMLGLALIVLGVLALESGALFSASNLPALSVSGVLCLVAALASWTWFAIANSAFLRTHPDISHASLTSAMGLISCAAITTVMLFTVDVPALFRHPDIYNLVMWTAAIGFGSTWFANWLWNRCSANCPPSISGPLLVTETVFGLLFTFIYQHRLPDMNEAAAIALFGLGVVLAVRSEVTHA